MKNILFFVVAIIIFISCSKEKLTSSPGGLSGQSPKPIFDTFNLRVAIGEWELDHWALLDSDSAYFTILPRFNTLPGLADKADSIKAENIVSVKIKMGSMIFQVDNRLSSRPFSYSISNAPNGGPNNTLLIHWWMARPAFQLVDSVNLQLKFLK